LPGATDDHIGMRDLEERTPPEDVAIDNPLAFAVFALTHAACGDVMEVRIGERCILGWCPSCASVRTFFPRKGSAGAAAR